MGLSARTAWPAVENELTRRAAEPGRVRWDFTRTNPTSLGLSPSLGDVLSRPEANLYDPHPRGLRSAREAVARHHARHGAVVDADRILLSAGTSEAYANAFHVLADPGDEVLVPSPGYPLFDFLADLAGVRLVPYPLVYDGAWHVDLPELRRRIGPRTRAVVVVSPNNPTGSYLSAFELADLVALSDAHDLAIVADEVFFDHPLGTAPGGPSAATATAGLVLTMSGLSKVCALPQVKVAWTLVGGDRRRAEAAVARLEIVADTYLSVSTPAQVALPDLLALAPSVTRRIGERTSGNLAAIRRALAGTPATLLRAEGGWSAMIRLPATRTEEDWVLALLDVGVLVQPGHFYDAEGGPFVVVSLLPAAEELSPGIAALAELVSHA